MGRTKDLAKIIKNVCNTRERCSKRNLLNDKEDLCACYDICQKYSINIPDKLLVSEIIEILKGNKKEVK